MKYSKAIFGSTLRSNFDSFSDHDLLIVADDASTLNKLRKIYSDSKWSVSYYTYSRLQKISNKGGLFIQHLKSESSILIDDKNQLKNILDTFLPKESYSNDVLKSLDFFKYFNTFCNSHSISLNGWISDVIYVGLRNLLIYEYADIKVYEFSYLKLLEKFNKLLSAEDINTLKNLRAYRRNYREGSVEYLPNNIYIYNLFKILKDVNLIPVVEFCSENKFKNKIIDYINNPNIDPYIKLRLFEALYILSGIENEEIINIIKNPQIYTFNFNDQKFIDKMINVIEEQIIHLGINIKIQS